MSVWFYAWIAMTVGFIFSCFVITHLCEVAERRGRLLNDAATMMMAGAELMEDMRARLMERGEQIPGDEWKN